MGVAKIIAKLASGILALGMGESASGDPMRLNYSGRLANPDGSPVQGPVTLEVKFFDTEVGGAPLIAPKTFHQVPLVDGIFNVDLDLSEAERHTVFSSTQAWIEITETGRAVTYPRQRFGAVPYALKVPVDSKTLGYDASGRLGFAVPPPAMSAFLKSDGAGNLVWESAGGGSAADPDSVSTAAIQDQAVTATKLADQVVTTAKLADQAVTTAKLADEAVTTAKLADQAVTSGKIADGTITDQDISASAGISMSKINGLNAALAAKADAAHGHDASEITSGTFAVARIPDLDAGMITTGTLADALIPATIARDTEVPQNTDQLTEGAVNRYFTEARARGAISATAPLVFDGGTGELTIAQASEATDGYLSSTDYQEFKARLGSTTSAMDLYVDGALGDDANDCSGNGAVACKTIARVLRVLPFVIRHAVTIHIQTGTYSDPLDLTGRVIEANGLLTIQGVGGRFTVDLGGAAGSALVVAHTGGASAITVKEANFTNAGTHGLFCFAARLHVENVSFDGNGSDGVKAGPGCDIQHGAGSFSASSNGEQGIEASMAIFRSSVGNVSINGNGSEGVASHDSWVEIEGESIQIGNASSPNTGVGIAAYRGSSIRIIGTSGSRALVRSASGNGITVQGMSHGSFQNINVNSHSAPGTALFCYANSYCVIKDANFLANDYGVSINQAQARFEGTVNINNNASNGLSVVQGSFVEQQGHINLQNNGSSGAGRNLYIVDSRVLFWGTFTVTKHASAPESVIVSWADFRANQSCVGCSGPSKIDHFCRVSHRTAGPLPGLVNNGCEVVSW